MKPLRVATLTRYLPYLLLIPASLPAQYDVLIKNGKIVDGSGNPWFYGDVAVRGETIAAIGKLTGATARETIDAHGLVIAPGFIDIHSHGRRGIFSVPTAENCAKALPPLLKVLTVVPPFLSSRSSTS
jgi:predicted amidohydrolase YtcJ